MPALAAVEDEDSKARMEAQVRELKSAPAPMADELDSAEAKLHGISDVDELGNPK